jgi:hypothetical protein
MPDRYDDPVDPDDDVDPDFLRHSVPEDHEIACEESLLGADAAGTPDPEDAPGWSGPTPAADGPDETEWGSPHVDLSEADANCVSDGDLSDQDRLLVNALARGLSQAKAGSLIGRSAKTVQRRMADPAFRAEVSRARNDRFESLSARLDKGRSGR